MGFLADQEMVKTLTVMHYTDKILEILNCQLRNDENSMTQSDLQGAIQAIVTKILEER